MYHSYPWFEFDLEIVNDVFNSILLSSFQELLILHTILYREEKHLC